MHYIILCVTVPAAQTSSVIAPHITIKPHSGSSKHLSYTLPSATPTRAAPLDYTIKINTFKPLFQFTALMHLCRAQKNGPPSGRPFRKINFIKIVKYIL